MPPPTLCAFTQTSRDTGSAHASNKTQVHIQPEPFIALSTCTPPLHIVSPVTAFNSRNTCPLVSWSNASH
eukprot:m.729 g.729  ORF g.729 m.729 type:complete len:70 (+) comp273_c0_seq1:494-703(+)